MRSYRFWFVAFASACVLVAAACGGAQPRPRPTGVAGGTGAENGNGLLPEAYHATELDLDQFMKSPSQDVSLQLYNKAHDDAYHAGDKKGKETGVTYRHQGEFVMQYLIGCALPVGEKLPVSPFAGEGIMTTNAAVLPPWQPVPFPWPGDAPDEPANVRRREDIHTCLITRLNPSATPVGIFLSGPHVKPADPVGFPNEEAVWLATIEKPGAEGHLKILLDVWPLPNFPSTLQRFADRRGGTATLDADAAASAALQERTCGTAAGAQECGLTPHRSTELEHDCKKQSDLAGGIWWCRDPRVPCHGDCTYDRPAIATHLSEDGFKTVYQAYLSK